MRYIHIHHGPVHMVGLCTKGLDTSWGTGVFGPPLKTGAIVRSTQVQMSGSPGSVQTFRVKVDHIHLLTGVGDIPHFDIKLSTSIGPHFHVVV